MRGVIAALAVAVAVVAVVAAPPRAGEDRSCQCKHGTPKVGDACDEKRANDCERCDDDYRLTEGRACVRAGEKSGSASAGGEEKGDSAATVEKKGGQAEEKRGQAGEKAEHTEKKDAQADKKLGQARKKVAQEKPEQAVKKVAQADKKRGQAGEKDGQAVRLQEVHGHSQDSLWTKAWTAAPLGLCALLAASALSSLALRGRRRARAPAQAGAESAGEELDAEAQEQAPLLRSAKPEAFA